MVRSYHFVRAPGEPLRVGAGAIAALLFGLVTAATPALAAHPKGDQPVGLPRLSVPPTAYLRVAPVAEPFRPPGKLDLVDDLLDRGPQDPEVFKQLGRGRTGPVVAHRAGPRQVAPPRRVPSVRLRPTDRPAAERGRGSSLISTVASRSRAGPRTRPSRRRRPARV